MLTDRITRPNQSEPGGIIRTIDEGVNRGCRPPEEKT
jgi:hypothetical protein